MSSHKKTLSDEDFVPDSEDQLENDAMNIESVVADQKKKKRRKKQLNKETTSSLNEISASKAKEIESGKDDKVKDGEEVITGQTCFNELFRHHTKIASHVGHGGEDILTQGLDLIGEKTLKEWDQEWKDVQIKQMGLNMISSKLFHDQTQALLEALEALKLGSSNT